MWQRRVESSGGGLGRNGEGGGRRCGDWIRGVHFLTQVRPNDPPHPHPGPLPFEGRGSATSDPEVSTLVSRVRGIRVSAVSKSGAATRSTKGVRQDFPLPLTAP